MTSLDEFRGFLVHTWADLRRDRLFLTGRLEDGRSFAAAQNWRPGFHIYEHDCARCAVLLSSIKHEVQPSPLESFSGREKLCHLCFFRYGDRIAAARILEQAGIPSPDMDARPPDLFLAEKYIRGFLRIRGAFRPGRLVDMVFPDAELLPPDERPIRVVLQIASIDIETDTKDQSIRAVAIAQTDSDFQNTAGLVRVLFPPGGEKGAVTQNGTHYGTHSDTLAEPTAGQPGRLIFHHDEATLLRAFVADIQGMDPDVLTGWNFLDFDFPRLAERCEHHGIPFAIGRSARGTSLQVAGTSNQEGAKFFSGEGRRSAAALVPGRQVIDALRIVRSGPRRFPDYTLETVSQAVLGEGKIVTASGKDKIAELDRLYADDPETFGKYCFKDAALVPGILAKTGLFRLTRERAALTGVSLDKAWTSVVSFERIYGMELRRRFIAPPPPPPPEHQVSGAVGGTVLEPMPGLFNNVAVFDFRSLYPTIMRTFNVDPLAHERSALKESPADSAPSSPPIRAPNGAEFSRQPGILPELIAEYFAARRKALDAGDENAAFVYKILMNSFYGVLGTSACRYGRTELAGSITTFARKWLLLSQDWFTEKGYQVLYGDTDSLFVETGLGDGASYTNFAETCGALATELNSFLTEQIESEYQVESFLELRFEKAYRRFLIPPLRGFHDEGAARGRAKGYAGYLLDSGGGVSVEVKGMEAVRSDATPLARRVQMELLELVFSGKDETAFRERVFGILRELGSGNLDGELVYRKRLSRPPETYTSSTPPQVKAARALGWKGRRGTVEFVWTTDGPEPASMPHAPYDYDHYTDSQVLPVVLSIAAAAGWDTEQFPRKGRGRQAWVDLAGGQLEFEF
ncbi:DNA polymerase domain-containing protein [Treponema primitia]|uniref:DNA polymerase domain-containing protein n=1 Tax=Treponema primitia TaxID=88058 RepID=UPI001FE22625|nr:DNA polymerase domain-containing protein [Treponema primitia]